MTGYLTRLDVLHLLTNSAMLGILLALLGLLADDRTVQR